MRVLVISGDWRSFTESSPVAARFRMQARTVERLDVLIPNGPKELLQIAGNAAVRGFGLGKVLGSLRTIAAGWRIARPDVVSAQDPFFLGTIAWIIARMRGSRLHLQVHTDLYSPQYRSQSQKQRVQLILARFLLQRADSVRTVAEHVAASLRSKGVRNVSVLPVHINLEGVKNAEPIDRHARYPQFKKLVLSVARLEPEKQVDDTIRAFGDIVKSVPSAGLVILNGGSERERLEGLVQELGIADRVVFEGAQDPFPFFKAADLMLSTSRYEGYGMAIVEALAAGCPVVTYDVGIAKEAGAIIASRERLPQVAVAVLSEGKKGKLMIQVPSESEYRDLWFANISAADWKEQRPIEDAVSTPRIGFIGQGFIGKAYSDEFEARDIPVVRYSLEEPYRANKDKIKECDLVFIAVPTPTTEDGFDASIVKEAVGLVGAGKTAVIKSTMLPRETEEIARAYPDRFVMHSPEFLREATAAYDAAHPDRNIIGIPKDTAEYRAHAEAVLRVLPPAPFELICSAKEAELTKYAANNWLFLKVVYTNLIYDLAQKLGANYGAIRDGLAADPRIGRSHLDPIHQSGHGGKPGRGAGGHCFIKDFEAMRRLYEEKVGDEFGTQLLDAAAAKNVELLEQSGKDLDLLEGVYGKDFQKRRKEMRR